MRLRAVLASALALAAGAGCGSEPAADTPAGPVKTVPAGEPVRVVGREYSFTPARVRTGGAEPIRVLLTNEGSLAHNLRIFQGARELGGTPTFQSGTRDATVRLAPGRYRMVCTVGDHEQLGMVGELEVAGPGTPR